MSNSDWLREGLRAGRARFKEEEKKEKVESRTGMAKW